MVQPLSLAPFPVYGLVSTYPGPRWLDSWNTLVPDGPLWTVTLGYGTPGTPNRLGVITDAKLPRRPIPSGFVGPTGLIDARRMALLEMVVTATPPAKRRSADFVSAVNMAGGDNPLFNSSTATVIIDNQPTEVSISHYRGGWAAHCDLGRVAIAFFGVDVDPETLTFESVELLDLG